MVKRTYVEELSQSSSAQDPRVSSSVGVTTVAPIEDAWVTSGGIIHIDLKPVKKIHCG